ncbi:MAG: nucA [Nitrososphaeraceae archaeon]|jgi:V8-like Glu-specific endopeptidase|nr:nucA [Nitrososphaeraceae archaeon]
MTDKRKLGDNKLIDDSAINRFKDRQQKRSRVIDTLKTKKTEDILKLDTEDRVQARKNLLSKQLLSPSTIERVIGGNDLMPIYYLEQGRKVANSVSRIEIIDQMDNILGHGTGFMISPSLLMTNNHVLSTPEDCKKSLAQFHYEKGENNRTIPTVEFSLDPNKFFYTNEELDFTLVAVNSKSLNDQPLSNMNYLKLLKEEGKAIIGEYVTIIQHPRGEPKQLAIRENRVIDILPNFVHSATDTFPGSSGSPVFNDQWNVVSLHHSGVPKMDDQGNYLTKDGQIWTPDMGDDKINWIANESVRISAIVKHLEEIKPNLSAEQQTILDEFINTTKPS